MPNAKQRNKNRRTARTLNHNVRYAKHVCENCGELGAHWIVAGDAHILPFNSAAKEEGGFWTCNKLYVPDMLDVHMASKETRDYYD